MITVLNLFTFVPQNEFEETLFNFDKTQINAFISELDNDCFYLGGQIKMTYNDFINLESIEQVREIDRKKIIEYGCPANMLEHISMINHNKKLQFIENMIKNYNMIMTIREKEKLNENNSNYNI